MIQRTTLLLLILVIALGTLRLAAQTPSVVLTPPSQQIQQDSIGYVRIRVNDIQHLHAYHVQISYNPLLVRCRRVQKLNFFGASTFFSNINDSIGGQVTVDEALLGPGGQSGSGDLAELRFLGLARGLATLSITNADFRDSVNQPIVVTMQGATIQVGQPNSVGEVSRGMPWVVKVENYPNPFNPSTTIRYSTGEGGETAIRIYSVLGREVYCTTRRDAPYSIQEFVWRGQDMNNIDVTSGTYVVRVSRRNAVGSTKVLLLR